MALPFGAASWKKLGDINGPTLFGAISGAVFGQFEADYAPKTKVVHTAGPIAHDFTQYFGAAQASLDGGSTWADTYRGDLDTGKPEFVFKHFNVVSPVTGRTMYFQLRARVEHSFFVADGTLFTGGITLYGSESGVGFTRVQDLYTWPHIIANPANTGGNNVLSSSPSCSGAIMLPGTGPSGEDAFWMVVGFQIDCGGTNNRQTIKRLDLWRSTDGIFWEVVRDLSGVSPFSGGPPNVGPWFQSDSGRLFLGTAYTTSYTNELLTTSWNLIGGLVPFIGNIVPMYGGTLASYRNGSLISGGFGLVSCDDGGNMVSVGGPPIATNAAAFNLKMGPSEVIIVTPGFIDPATQTVCWYSADGGETYQGGEVWLASTVGERPIAMFKRSDGRPLVITTSRAYFSGDIGRGVANIRTVCPLANAGLLAAAAPRLCGAPIAVNQCD